MFCRFLFAESAIVNGIKSYAMIYCVAVGSIGGLVFLFSQFGKMGFEC